MSFEWNLSDDEGDEEDLLKWSKRARLEDDDKAERNDDFDRYGQRTSSGDLEEGRLLGAATGKPASSVAAEAAAAKDSTDSWNDWTNPADYDDGSSSSVDDDESINWEDAHAAEGSEDDRKPAASPAAPSSSCKAITIDLNEATHNADPREGKNKRRKRASRLVLGREAQRLVRNLSRAHLLALVSRTVFLSSLAADETLQAILCSVFPVPHAIERKMPELPTMDEVLQVVDSFLQWQTLRNDRLRANARAGAPAASRRGSSSRKRKKNGTTMAASVQPTPPVMSVHRFVRVAQYWSDPDPQLDDAPALVAPTDADRVALFVAVARALNWRARLVAAVDPIPPDASLDVHHPLLQAGGGGGGLLRLVRLLSMSTKTSSSNDAASSQATTAQLKRFKKSAVVTPPDEFARSGLSGAAGSAGGHLCWAEILCAVPSNGQGKKSTQRRWVHVDPVHRLVHRPDVVESIVGSQSRTDECVEPMSKPSDKTGTFRTSGNGHLPAPMRLSKQGRIPLSYAVAVEHADAQNYHVTDVTPRYASSWVASLRKRSGHGCGPRGAVHNVNVSWWVTTLERINHGKRASEALPQTSPKRPLAGGTSASDAIQLADDDEDSNSDIERQRNAAMPSRLFDEDEAVELQQTTRALNDAIPTTKAVFTNHPVYALASVLGTKQVLHPEAKTRVCGVFKGELIYRRSDVSVARSAGKWLYEGRRVRQDELANPVKRAKPRKKSVSKMNSFQALLSYGVGAGNDGSEAQQLAEIAKGSAPLGDNDEALQNLYGVWQTDAWTPPYVGPEEAIPVHETYRTIELALMNPGLVHIDQRGMAPIAKQLGIPYAPCHIGFEGRGGKRAPTIQGIVVHEHNAQLVREASVEVYSRSVQQEFDSQRNTMYKLWKRLMRGLLVKDRIEREYGDST